MSVSVIPFDPTVHRSAVIHLWRSVFGYGTAHNDPELAINRKLAVEDRLFFVAVADAVVVGSIMAGYDGHRGWLYSLAVLPGNRKMGTGSALVAEAERALAALGCMKINLQIMPGNESVQDFYASLGYSAEVRLSMGKIVPQNIEGLAV